MEKIAITGLGCVLPGVQSPEALWQVLNPGLDLTSPISKQELGVDPANYLGDYKGQKDKIGYNKNGHVRDFQFDPSGYRIDAEQLQKLDKLYQWTLFAADAALTDAGYSKQQPPDNCGLLLGGINMPTHAVKQQMTGFYHKALTPHIQKLLGRGDFQFKNYWQDNQWLPENLMVGSHNVTVAAQALGLNGPCYTLDGACSSGIYAIDIACRHLQSGQADVMLAGATCHADHIYINHGFNVLQAFPQNGKGESIPLDKNSGGLKAGEGVGVVALKRYADAIRDGDHIYGVIDAIGLSNDAGAKHMLVPDSKGQMLALERAYNGLTRQPDYIECHATGTGVGDQTELNSISQFFSDRGELPKIGANKANLGHLLTASSMVSLFKVLMSMSHNEIPATIGVNDFIGSEDGKLDHNALISQTQPWPQKVKVAGINAFGFGGVNGHLVVSSGVTPEDSKQQTGANDPLSIVGMCCNMPNAVGLSQFDQMIKSGGHGFDQLPNSRWSGLQDSEIIADFGLNAAPVGAYMAHFDFDCLRYKIPPNAAGIHLLSHLSMMPMAERAYLDAGYKQDGQVRNIAVIIAGDADCNGFRYQARTELAWQIKDSIKAAQIELNPQELEALETIVKDAVFPEPNVEGVTGGIGNIVASRISALLKLNGPAFTIQSQENSTLKAIEVARLLLATGQIEAAIVGGGCFSGCVEDVLNTHLRSKVNTSNMDLPPLDGRGLKVGEGVGVIVVKPQHHLKQQDRVYAKIKALNLMQSAKSSELNFKPDAGEMAACANKTLSQAGLTGNDIDYIELHSSGIANQDQAERESLDLVYNNENPIVVGSVKNNIGHLRSASAIAGIIKTALCLYSRVLPKAAHCEQTQMLATPGQANLALLSASQSKPDFNYAALNTIGADACYGHMILQAADSIEREALDLRKPAWATVAHDNHVKRIYPAGELTFAQAITSESNMQRFAHLHQRTASTHDWRMAEYVRNIQTQSAFLQALTASHQQIAQMCEQQMPVEALPTEKWPAPQMCPIQVSPRSANALFNEAQLQEMTDGSVAAVLGNDFLQTDSYPVRTRMPSAPYMFVSRILHLTAKPGELQPCEIEWEYDIQPNEWFVVNGATPSFVALESSHAMIVAYTVIGCDQIFKGEHCYRAVNSQTTMIDGFPKAGEILHGKLAITSFKKMGKNVLIDYTYDCYVIDSNGLDRHCFQLKAASGFFHKASMGESRSMNNKALFSRAEKQAFPLSTDNLCPDTRYDSGQISALMTGELSRCFGPGYQDNPAAKLCNPSFMMLERVKDLDPLGGPWGLGTATGEIDIDTSHWVFQAHFKNDPCLPGTLMVEGCQQLFSFYLSYLGLNSDSRLVSVVASNHTSSANFRGEVKYANDTLGYRLVVKALTVEQTEVEVIAVIEMLYQGKIIGVCDNMIARYRVSTQGELQ